MHTLLLLFTLLAPGPSAAPDCSGAAGQRAASDLATAVGAAAQASGTALPVPRGTRISSSYGWRTHPVSGRRQFHTGVDFALGRGSNVVSPGAGRVTFAGWAGGYGRLVEVTLGDGTVVTYAHLQDYAGMQVGTAVQAGTVVGHVNSSGTSTGDHLHLEVVDGRGVRQDPVTWFRY